MDEGALLVRNLRDAGCSEAEIRRFPVLAPAEQARFLAGRRTALLSELHACQSRIDSLDYLLYVMKKK